MTLNPICENVETAQGVPLTVTGVAQVKIMKNPELLHTSSTVRVPRMALRWPSRVCRTVDLISCSFLPRNCSEAV